MQLSPLYLEQIQAAKQQQQQEIAVNLLRKNILVEVISETTGVSIDYKLCVRNYRTINDRSHLTNLDRSQTIDRAIPQTRN